MEKETKQRKKLPMWLTVIIAIIVSVVVIAILGELSINDFNNKSKEYEQKARESLERGETTYSPEEILK